MPGGDEILLAAECFVDAETLQAEEAGQTTSFFHPIEPLHSNAEVRQEVEAAAEEMDGLGRCNMQTQAVTIMSPSISKGLRQTMIKGRVDEPIDVDAVLACWQREHHRSQQAVGSEISSEGNNLLPQRENPLHVVPEPMESPQGCPDRRAGTGDTSIFALIEDVAANVSFGSFQEAAQIPFVNFSEAARSVVDRTAVKQKRVSASRAVFPELRTPLAKYLLRCLASPDTSASSSAEGAEDHWPRDEASSISDSVDEESCYPRRGPPPVPSARYSAMGSPEPPPEMNISLDNMPSWQQKWAKLSPVASSPSELLAETREMDSLCNKAGPTASAGCVEEDAAGAEMNGQHHKRALMAADIRLLYPHLF